MPEEVVTVRLPDALIKELNALAKETGRSRTDLIREAVMALIGMYKNASQK